MLIHVLGNSTNMDKLMKILKKNKIILIEDTCESIGAKYKKKFLGNSEKYLEFPKKILDVEEIHELSRNL